MSPCFVPFAHRFLDGTLHNNGLHYTMLTCSYFTHNATTCSNKIIIINCTSFFFHSLFLTFHQYCISDPRKTLCQVIKKGKKNLYLILELSLKYYTNLSCTVCHCLDRCWSLCVIYTAHTNSHTVKNWRELLGWPSKKWDQSMYTLCTSQCKSPPPLPPKAVTRQGIGCCLW